MALQSNTGTVGKLKDYIVQLSGFASVGTNTSEFGSGADVNCTDVEYFSLNLPDKSENESVEMQSNKRKFKDDTANKGWEDWDGLEVFNDSALINWKAFVAAQETDATGTVTILAQYLPSGTTVFSTSTVGAWKAKVAKAGGGGGDASAFNSSFTPTLRILGMASEN